MPRIIGGSLGAHREQMRTKIFSAFTELLESTGYDALTLADVATHVGVGRTAMYNYYTDKEALLLDYTADMTERYLAALERELSVVSNPVDQLRTYIRMQAEEFAHQHVPLNMTAALSEEGRRDMREHVMPLLGSLRNIIENGVSERYLSPGDIGLKMQFVSGSVSGRWTSDLGGAELDQAIEEATDFVLRGLGARIAKGGRPRRLPGPTPRDVLDPG